MMNRNISILGSALLCLAGPSSNAAEIGVQTGDDNPQAIVGERLSDWDNLLIKKLRLVYAYYRRVGGQ